MLRFKNLNVYHNKKFIKSDVFIDNDVINIYPSCSDDMSDWDIFFTDNTYLLPGFIDVHVHLREPGFSYKETIKTGTQAAARGGFTTVCTMPNVNPVPDSLKNLKIQQDIIDKTACIEVIPYASITKGEKGIELSDMEDLAKHVVGFSDDGVYVNSADVSKQAMIKAKQLGKIIASHCEDEKFFSGGYINDGAYSKKYGHIGISNESEYMAIKRDIELVKQTGCKYHVCHVSCKESVDIIRQAKKDGINITAEVTPHHVCLDESILSENGIYVMYPPLRTYEDRMTIIEGIVDGTIDCFATDHAPHTLEEKSKGLKDSAKGMVGLETSFPILYTQLVKTGIISFERLIDMLHTNPATIFGIGSPLKHNGTATFTIFNMDEQYTINAKNFLSKAKFSPFDGTPVYSKCLLTMYKGNIVYQDSSVAFHNQNECEK